MSCHPTLVMALLNRKEGVVWRMGYFVLYLILWLLLHEILTFGVNANVTHILFVIILWPDVGSSLWGIQSNVKKFQSNYTDIVSDLHWDLKIRNHFVPDCELHIVLIIIQLQILDVFGYWFVTNGKVNKWSYLEEEFVNLEDIISMSYLFDITMKQTCVPIQNETIAKQYVPASSKSQ